MREWCYTYLTTGEVDVLRICKDDIDDIEFSLLISKVEEATDLSEFTDEIVSCGYTGTFNIDQKDAIIRAIVLHVYFESHQCLETCVKAFSCMLLLAIDCESHWSDVNFPSSIDWLRGGAVDQIWWTNADHMPDNT
ncbi:hypothetical protein QQF64_023839 [Cirrhinus molitorella]|uniref:Uncharacterized protein n=1 Tax=Cirrhinus molitorella TaxID=172907 RepID=A0ABR3NJJ5_9TELE